MPGGDRRLASHVLGDAATSVTELLGRPVSYGELSAAIAQGFAEALGVGLARSELSPEEQVEARRLRERKYAAAQWTERMPRRG